MLSHDEVRSRLRSNSLTSLWWSPWTDSLNRVRRMFGWTSFSPREAYPASVINPSAITYEELLEAQERVELRLDGKFALHPGRLILAGNV